MLSLETAAPLMPFRVTGVWPFDHANIWKGLLRRCRASVQFGDLMDLETPNVDSKSAIRAGTKQVKRALHALR